MKNFVLKFAVEDSAVDMLYGELDESNRNKLVARALECFDGMSEKKK